MRRLIVLVVSLMSASCGVPQSAECQQYVACESAYDAAAGLDQKDTAHWQADGDCWVAAEPAAQCTADCATALTDLKAKAADANLDVPECG